MAKKLTITDILAQKEAIKQKKLAKQTLFVKSLDAEITIQEPTKVLIMESVGMEDDSDADEHIVYHCMVEPNLRENYKELMEQLGCSTPYEIVARLFKPGEINNIAQRAMDLAGYERKVSNVKVVKEIKN